MSVGQQVSSDHQLARLLQIGIVLEEVVEARSVTHLEELDSEPDAAVASLLQEAADESQRHRRQLESLIQNLDVETVPFEEVESLVGARYGRTRPADFDGVLYDQLCNEETAYKFYDDLIGAVEDSEASISVNRVELVAVLREIRAEEAEGVEEVARVMEAR
ncbi:MAG: Rubrerythrin [uncultured archaeon A07HR60]|nr:MAG: Rubrerythrin [Halorubrum sp. J07HR59]ESS11656.1 MAG: Rubrerythrin [uncultured archaeon A07HR60]